MFDFQKLEVYKKAKHFLQICKTVILENKLDRYVNDQLGKASFCQAFVDLNSLSN